MTEIKICGITDTKEIDRLIELGIEYAGFVMFYDKSKRNNTLSNAESLVRYMKDRNRDIENDNAKHIKAVAVTVSPTISQLEAIENAGFDILQIHGVLSAEVRKKCSLPIWRAVNVQDNTSVEVADRDISGIVLDGAIPGSGKTFSWDEFLNFDCKGKKYVLAGGLNADNIEEAIYKLNPDVVDVSSGVEYDDIAKKGKDLDKITLFVERVKNFDKKF